jgi:Serine-threonine protein kinase 19
MFTPLPERAAGMSSTRIAEVLNFRRALPPIVTVAHVHALLNAPTTTEREVVELMREGVVRKLVVPGREAGVGEGLVLVKEWERVIRENKDLSEEIKRMLFTSYSSC